MNTHEDVHLRLYAALLRLYPHRFRQEYGQEMLRYFRDSHRDAHADGTIGLIALWARELGDLLVNALAARAGQVAGFFSRADTYARLAAVFCVLTGALCGLDVILEWDDTVVNGSDPIIEAGLWLMLLTFPLAMLGLYLRRPSRPGKLERFGYAMGFAGAALVALGFGLSGFVDPFWLVGMIGLIVTLLSMMVIGVARGSADTRHRPALEASLGFIGLLWVALQPGNFVGWWGTIPPLHRIADISSELAWAVTWVLFGWHLWTGGGAGAGRFRLRKA